MALRAIAILTAGLTVAACSDSVGPRAFAGTYGLYDVLDNETPPITIYIGSTRTTIYQRIELLADTLELRNDGSYLERGIFRGTDNETTANPTVTIDTSTAIGTFAVGSADTLTFVPASSTNGCAFLCGLQVKTATSVVVRADTLAFQGVVFGGLTWNPRYQRRP